MNIVYIGADPELFLKKNGKFHSAYGTIPGTKRKPYPVPGGAVQIDGMALEFNINPVETTLDFTKNIESVLYHLSSMLPDDMLMTITPWAKFSPEHMADQPRVAKQLGCDPDFNPYTMDYNDLPKDNKILRTAAGHVHIGFLGKDNEVDDPYHPEHLRRCADLAIELDCTLGLYSTFIDHDIIRREMYGCAGAFRPKKYGMEYRVPSNYWIKNNKTIESVFNIARHTTIQVLYNDVSYQEEIVNTCNKTIVDIQSIINNGSYNDARDVLTRLDIEEYI